jgi:hypothetical protein
MWIYWPVLPPRSTSLMSDLILCAAIIGYLMAQYRILGLHVAILPADPSRKGEPPTVRDSQSVPGHEPFAALLLAGAAAIGSLFVWQLTTLIRAPWGLSPSYWRVELLVWILAVGVILTASILGYFSWRRQSRAEALMVLRDEFWRQTRGDQRRTNRWRAWARRRAERGGQAQDE